MIEIIVADRCTGCNICVKVCPTQVFEEVPKSPPRIAQQADCQTCFMCELYCPEDALYVAPQTNAIAGLSASAPELHKLLGSYRQSIGWAGAGQAGMPTDNSFEIMKRAH